MSHGLNTKYLPQAHMLCSAPELMVEFGEVEEASEDEAKLKEAGHWGFLKHMPGSQSLVLYFLSTRR